jgi:hypothetical protein
MAGLKVLQRNGAGNKKVRILLDVIINQDGLPAKSGEGEDFAFSSSSQARKNPAALRS